MRTRKQNPHLINKDSVHEFHIFMKKSLRAMLIIHIDICIFLEIYIKMQSMHKSRTVNSQNIYITIKKYFLVVYGLCTKFFFLVELMLPRMKNVCIHFYSIENVTAQVSVAS